ncbi:Non-specific lipid-transfer protein 3-like protein [Drosera capensis]
MASLSLCRSAFVILACVAMVATVTSATLTTIAPECKVITPMFREFCGPAVKTDVTPDPTCCTILTMGNTYMTDQAACQCYRAAVQSIGGYSWFLSSGLPNRCNVHLDYPISRSMNCSSL